MSSFGLCIRISSAWAGLVGGLGIGGAMAPRRAKRTVKAAMIMTVRRIIVVIVCARTSGIIGAR